MKILLSTPEGLEEVAAEEAREIAGRACVTERGLVEVETDELGLVRLNLWGRTFTRVLLEVCSGRMGGLEDMLREINRNRERILECFRDEYTFAVRCQRSGKHGFTSLDAAREAGGVILNIARSAGLRVGVNLRQPTLEFYLKIRDDRFYLGINTSGEGLNKRGYRVYNHPAALNPVIAAGMVRMLGWKGQVPLLDPMCGGATIPIEACLSALDRAPGLYKSVHPLVQLSMLDARIYWEERKKAERVAKRAERKLVYAGDVSAKHLAGGMRNAESAGVREAIEFLHADCRHLYRHLDEGEYWFCVNPPYGVRSTRKGALPHLYREMLRSLLSIGATRGEVITSESELLEEAAREAGYGLRWRRRLMHGNLPAYVHFLEA